MAGIYLRLMPNNPLQPTVKKLRFLPSAELARSARNDTDRNEEMRHWRNHQINRAAVLLAIREGKAKSYDDLERLFIPTSIPPSPRCMFERDLALMVDEFVTAGLLEKPSEPNSYLKTTDLLSKIQTALAVSLNELSQVDADTITVSPLFGAPELQDDFPEVFVLMPFSNNLKPVFEDHIRVVVNELGLSVGRADDFFAASQ